MADVDLTRLAVAYDHRSDHGTSERVTSMLDQCAIGPGSHVVDVGGGRGAQATAARLRGAEVTLIDPAMKMLQYAAARANGVAVVQGVGEALPLASASADLVHFHLSIHHGDWRTMLDEAWRVVRPGGFVWVWTMADAHHRASLLAQWFSRVADIDERRFPPVQAIVDHLTDLGGTATTMEVIHSKTRSVADWIDAVEAGFVSTLHLLTPSELDDGLRRFRVAHPDPSEEITYEVQFAGVALSRPPLRS